MKYCIHYSAFANGDWRRTRVTAQSSHKPNPGGNPTSTGCRTAASPWEREGPRSAGKGWLKMTCPVRGGTEKRLGRRPQRIAHRSDGGRADQQGLNINEILLLTARESSRAGLERKM